MKATTNKSLDPIEQRMLRGRKIARGVTAAVLVAVGVTALINPDLFSAKLHMPSEQEREEARKERQKKQGQKPKRRLSKRDVERLAKLRQDRARKHMMEILWRLEQRIIVAEKQEVEVTAKFREDPHLFDALGGLVSEHAGKVSSAISRSRMKVYEADIQIRKVMLDQILEISAESIVLNQCVYQFRKTPSQSLLGPVVQSAERLAVMSSSDQFVSLLGQQTVRYALSIQSNALSIKNQDRDLAVRGFAQPEDHPLTLPERSRFRQTVRPMTMAELHEISQKMAEHYKNLMGDVTAGELAEAAQISFPEALDKLAHEPYAKDDMQKQLKQELPEDVDQLDQFTEALTEAQQSAERALKESGGEGGGDKRGDVEEGEGDFGSGGGKGIENSYQQGDPASLGQKSAEEVWRSLALRSDLAASQDRSRQITIDKKKVLANVLPGRRFTSDSKRKGYLFVDTWHVIGPWDAQASRGGQIDFSKIYPLEKSMDLDAIYSTGKTQFIYDDERGYFGKGERSGRLTWQFYQSPTVEVRIPREQLANDALYFAYTEVYFEEEASMHLAIASDDAARIRVNGLIVFEDTGLSPYAISEQVREVQFKRGVNKILVRLVNGPGPCRFSLLLVPKQ